MNLERLLELVFSNPDNISIQYQNINGKERLVVNGEELTTDDATFDDSRIKELVSNYKESIDSIDDCDFVEIIEEVGEHLDLKTFDELLTQESYSEEDAAILESMINFTKLAIHEHLTNKIEDIKEILANL